MLVTDHCKMSTLRLPELYINRLVQMSDDELRSLLSGDPGQAAVWVRAAAQAGLTAAQVRLGRMLLAGEGVTENRHEAVLWFRRAADKKDGEAMNMLGRCYENGWGVEADLTVAFGFYQRAAYYDDAWGKYNLGHCYLDGSGVSRNTGRAFHWYRRAAEQGHGRAMNLLGRCYEEGWGVVRDEEAAADWYRLSAESGYFRGQYNWASLLAVQNRWPEAAHWFLASAVNGTPAVRGKAAEALLAGGRPECAQALLTVLEHCSANGETLAAQNSDHAWLLTGLLPTEREKAGLLLQRIGLFPAAGS